MKYKTIIQITCDASDKEDACFIAGEYLRGALDSGVEMSTKTVSLNAQRAMTIVGTGIFAFLFFSLILVGFHPVSGDKVEQREIFRMAGTCTVQPELKTADEDSFKADWEKKKDEAILRYIKE